MLRIAIAQLPGVELGQWRGTLEQIDAAIARAADLRADVVVLPECAFPAYFIGSTNAYLQARADGLPDSPELLARVGRRCRELRVAVCIGYVEQRCGRLYNAATLVGVDGAPLHTHRKCFLWDFDHECFTPGDELRTCDTPFGRIGIMICADARQPEIAYTLAARGAQLLLQPTAWVNAGTPENRWNPQPEFLIPARARELGIPIASASKWGLEGSTLFVGSSLIVDREGRGLVRCKKAENSVVVSEVTPSSPHPAAISPRLRAVLQAPWRPPPDEPHRLRLASLPAEAAESFAPIRAAALQGADLVVLQGAARELLTLRARAAENRVYLCGTVDGRPCLIHPSGRVINLSEGDDPVAAVELSEARNKLLAPRTDPMTDRRPELYAL